MTTSPLETNAEAGPWVNEPQLVEPVSNDESHVSPHLRHRKSTSGDKLSSTAPEPQRREQAVIK